MQGPPMHRLHAHGNALMINFIANSETDILRRVEIVAKHSACLYSSTFPGGEGQD